jgi:hypothetical protein
MSHPTAQTQELWVGHNSIDLDDPRVGQFRHMGLFFNIILNNAEQNWLHTNLPSPNVREGWRIKSVKLRIRTEDSAFGGIDKVGIRDAERVVHEFGSPPHPLSITSFNKWQTVLLEVPGGPRPFTSSLGLSIHINNKVDTKAEPQPPFPPVKILVAGIGVEFAR